MIDLAYLAPALSGFAGAVVGALGTWLVKRAEKAPDMQETLSRAIDNVVEHYTAALDRADSESASLRDEIAEMRLLIEAQSRKIDAQSGEIEQLVGQIGGLEQQIVILGGQPPARRRRAKAESQEASA